MVAHNENDGKPRYYTHRLQNSAYTIIRRMLQNIPAPEANGEYHFTVNSNAPMAPGEDDIAKAALRERDAAHSQQLWQQFSDALVGANVFEARPDRFETKNDGDYKTTVLKVSAEEMEMLTEIGQNYQAAEKLRQHLGEIKQKSGAAEIG